MIAIGLPPAIQVASIGIPDTLFLMLLALVVFGPRRLPEIGRQIGKLMYEFRKVSNDFKFQMEEELRVSEEAARQQKLQAALPAAVPAAVPVSTQADSQALLNVPPHPVSESAPDFGSGSPESEIAASSDAEAQSEMPGEVRGEPEQYPQIQPPFSGETIAAAKPFRGRPAEHVAVETDIPAESVSESGAEPTRATDLPVVVSDEGRIGTEVQPGVSVEGKSGSERGAYHA
jgi:sec-independent protein translocase protein TatB